MNEKVYWNPNEYEPSKEEWDQKPEITIAHAALIVITCIALAGLVVAYLFIH